MNTLCDHASRWTRPLTGIVKKCRCRILAAGYNVADTFSRIYFYHVRKAGGTSLNHMFLALSRKDEQEMYKELSDASEDHCILVNGKVFVGWNKRLIEKGHYFYAFSHLPFHKVSLPAKTFTITCIRNPARRVLSHYKMLLAYRLSGAVRPDYEEEAQWLGNCFADFLTNIPKQHLLNQLYMFSSTFSVDEAYDNICNLSHFFITEAFDSGIADLSAKIGIALDPIHIRRARVEFEPDESDLARLHLMMEPEFQLYRRLQRVCKLAPDVVSESPSKDLSL